MPVIPFPFPIPATPSLPFSLPFGLTLPGGHILKMPPDKESCPCCTKEFLDCLIQTPFHWGGCSWALVINYKTYLILWRDRLPRPPATAQVWDLFRVDGVHCGCATTHRMGWQWCWDDVIKTIRLDVFSNWIGDTLYGGGHTHVLVGTNLFMAGSSFPQIGPVIHLDASNQDSVVVDGGGVAQWIDLSTKQNHAFQTDVGSRPTVDPASFQGKDTISFSPGQHFRVLLRTQTAWHLFAVARFEPSAETIGTIFSATGAEAPFSGFEAHVYQATNTFPVGSLATFVQTAGVVGFVGTQAPASTFGIMEWSEDASSIWMGWNAFHDKVLVHDLTADTAWSPVVQTAGNPVPMPAMIGRSTWSLGGVQPSNFLEGKIAEMLLYPAVLSQGQRIQVLNALRSKWGLGPPLAMPWQTMP